MDRSDLNQLRSFESEVRQLLDGYKQQQQELQALRVLLSSKDEEIGRLQTSIRSYERAYSNLKTARMLEVSDGDIRTAKLRITRLVREVNKCIRLLSAEMGDIGDSSESASSEREQETALSPSDGVSATSAVSDLDAEIEIDLTPESSQEVAAVESSNGTASEKESATDAAEVSQPSGQSSAGSQESEKDTSDIDDSESDISSDISAKDNETPEDDTDSLTDEPESPDVDAGPSKAETITGTPDAAPSDDKETTAGDAAEPLEDEQQPQEKDTVLPEGKTSPSKDSSKTHKGDPKSESLLLELENEPEPESKERDLWADFGMLPLFSDDEPTK